GMIQTIERSGRDDRAIIMRNGSTTEMQSALMRDSVRLIMEGEGIKRDAEGKPIASAEGLRLVSLYRKEDDAEVFVSLRGAGPQRRRVRGRRRGGARRAGGGGGGGGGCRPGRRPGGGRRPAGTRWGG